MGKDMACKTIEIGIVNIIMHDRVVKIMMDARNVLDLKKNIISLNTLDTNGCNIVKENGVMNIVCGFLVVMDRIKK